MITIINSIRYTLKNCNYKAVTTGYNGLQKKASCNRRNSNVTLFRLQLKKRHKSNAPINTANHFFKINFFVTVAQLHAKALQYKAYIKPTLFCNSCNREKRVYLKKGVTQ